MYDTQQIIDIKMQLSNLEKLVEQLVVIDKWLTIQEAAVYSSTSKSTLDRAVKKGTLKCSRQIGKRLFRRSAIDSWLENG